MSKDTYTKHLTETVTKTYKQCSRKKVKNINYNSKLIAQELSIDELKNTGNRSLDNNKRSQRSFST